MPLYRDMADNPRIEPNRYILTCPTSQCHHNPYLRPPLNLLPASSSVARSEALLPDDSPRSPALSLLMSSKYLAVRFTFSSVKLMPTEPTLPEDDEPEPEPEPEPKPRPVVDLRSSAFPAILFASDDSCPA
jgi:hypothetical protein